MSRWGMAIDLDRCTGCGSCMAACHQENNLTAVGPSEAALDRVFHWLRVLPEVSEAHAEVTVTYTPQLCVQCDKPPCVRVCPVHATYLSDEGIVAQIYARCIGCRYCMAACPYNAKVFNWYEPQWPGQLQAKANPDVSLRYKGVVEKCTFCHHRVLKAREDAALAGRGLRDGDVSTACEDSCPAKAIVFGDLDDPASRVSRLARSPRASRHHEDLGTEPKVYHLARKE
ncbi:MAG: 4Fe-4S dicluster domain-containing protein [Acidobacteriota bacterium]|nr:4Fe-4S dicluster domain-containing protein [Acidobacteriota bacterium]MDH3524555.1 4Fe-4S dicluster domain-containing protein [Acidobacteriota bacterium]